MKFCIEIRSSGKSHLETGPDGICVARKNARESTKSGLEPIGADVYEERVWIL